MPGKRYALERERRRAIERLNIATKHLRTAIVKENTREFRNNQQEYEDKKKIEYGKVVLDVPVRQRNDQIRRMEQKRAREKMARRRRNSEKIKKFYATKHEETDSDSEDEEDEVLDFHKQKSEVIFWNDPRIKMTKKDIHASSLAKSMGIMTIMVEDTEEEQRKEEHHLQLKGEAFSANGPLDRLKRNGLNNALVPRSKQRATSWNMNPEDKSTRECSPDRRNSASSSEFPEKVEDLIKNSTEGSVSFVKLGSLQSTSQWKSLDQEDQGDQEDSESFRKRVSSKSWGGSNIRGLTDDLDDATADMMAMIRNKKTDSESSSARSSIKSKYSIQFETDNSDGEEEEVEFDLEEEEDLYPELERFSLSLCQHDESGLSLQTPAGRILNRFEMSVSSAVEIVLELQDDHPMKLELLEALQDNLSTLKAEVKDNINLALLSSIVLQPPDLQTIAEEHTEHL